jgi:hypothetical protein
MRKGVGLKGEDAGVNESFAENGQLRFRNP